MYKIAVMGAYDSIYGFASLGLDIHPVSDIREGRNAGVRSLGVLEGSSVMGMTQAAYEALSAEKKQAALDRARQVFLEAGADDVLLNIEQLPAWIQAND